MFTALVIVAKQPVAGSVKTRLCPPLSHDDAAALARAFLDDTVGLASCVPGVAVVVGYAPDSAAAWFAATYPDVALLPQGDGDLGARMARLFEAASSQGFERVILIGSDTPQLSPQRIDMAITALESRDTVVLGPASDGGYYLIGLTTPCPALFERIAWSRETVLAETLSRVHSLSLQTALLPEERDIDTPADLAWLVSRADVLPAGSATRRLTAAVAGRL